MRTGIKTLIRKTIYHVRHIPFLFGGINPNVFPDKPVESSRIEAKLRTLQSELQERHVSYNLGSLYTLPHPWATEMYKRFIDYNPGNLGSWSDDASITYASTRFEYEVIHKSIDLYHGDHRRLSGYITSGGTEGNIYAVWLGRTFLAYYYKTDQICLLKTSLTHYSVTKAGILCHVHQRMTPLDNITWNIDIQGFRSTVQILYAQGYRGFIVPLTLGYTSTGTSDDVDAVIAEARKCEKKLKGIKFFFWIDAALNGLIAPFLDKNFRPFKSPEIQAFVVDFHKFGQVPYPAGIILYNKSLKKLIEQPIDYLSETDSTLLGSRSGIPAISIWAMMHTLGASGYKHTVEEQMRNKEFMMKHMKALSQKIEIISGSHSLSCGVVFTGFKNTRLPARIEAKYSLYPGNIRLLFSRGKQVEKRIYKIFFLPHVRKAIVKEFISDCQRAG